jgi:antitoxin PrlF
MRPYGLDAVSARYEIPTMTSDRHAQSRFVTSRLGTKSRTVVPKEVREALGVGPGDLVGYTIQNGRVILSAIRRPAAADDPFACFDEWASEADTASYAFEDKERPKLTLNRMYTARLARSPSTRCAERKLEGRPLRELSGTV